MPDQFPGIFIVFEGLDGAGCTTQMTMLEGRLARLGYPVTTTKEPSNGPFGATIRLVIEERLKSDPVALALAFAADRIDHLRNEANGIIKSLDEQKVVLCDRYVLSSLAYQRVFIEDPDWLSAINKFAFAPDLTVFIDTPVDECLRRIASRSNNDELFHEKNILVQVRDNYLELLNQRHAATGEIVTIDGSLAREDQHALVAAATLKLFRDKGFKTLFTNQ